MSSPERLETPIPSFGEAPPSAHPVGRPAIWSEMRTAQLRSLWLEGQSAAAIGKAMALSRNAVIGKIARLKLVRRPAAAGEPPAAHGVELRYKPAPRRGAVLTPYPRPEIPAQDLPATEALMALAVDHCLWPVGDPRTGDFAYCGRPCGRRQSYCAEHGAKAHDRRPLPPIETLAGAELRLGAKAAAKRWRQRFEGWERRR